MNLDQLRLEQLHGNQRELAETIGIEAYKRLVLKYGGGNIYICKPDTLLQPLRDAVLCSKIFPGSVYDDRSITAISGRVVRRTDESLLESRLAFALAS